MASDFSCKCFFCHQCAFFKCAADSHADNHRRTGIRAGIFYCRKNCFLYSFDSVCRFQHKYTAHIFASKAFWCDLDLHLIARNNFIMNDSRCIIFCILSENRIFHNGFSQISVNITPTDPFIYRIFQVAAFEMYILSDLKKYDCHSSILADWDHIFSGDLQIILKLA